MLKRHLNQEARAPNCERVMRNEIIRDTQRVLLTRLVVAWVAACSLSFVGASQHQEAPGVGERPRLIPLVAAESGYSENSSVNLLCTVSQGHHESLQFEWFKDGQLLGSPGGLSPKEPTLPIDQLEPPQLEKHTDHSLLRIARVQAAAHSGRYTCAAKSAFGQDSSSVNLIVNVKLRWIKEPARELVVSLNQELKVDCLAEGEPKPTMRWERHDSLGGGQQTHKSNLFISKQGGKHRQGSSSTSATSSNHYHIMESTATGGVGGKNQLAGGNHYHSDQVASRSSSSANADEVPLLSGLAESATRIGGGGSGNLLVSSSRHLTVPKVRESDAGTYECIASNGRDADLRKLVHVQVRGK